MSSTPARQDPAATFDWMAADSVAIAVIEAAAKVSAQDPTDLPVLYDAVDPDALHAIFNAGHQRPPESSIVVKFVFNDMLVHVRSDGHGHIFQQQ